MPLSKEKLAGILAEQTSFVCSLCVIGYMKMNDDDDKYKDDDL